MPVPRLTPRLPVPGAAGGRVGGGRARRPRARPGGRTGRVARAAGRAAASDRTPRGAGDAAAGSAARRGSGAGWSAPGRRGGDWWRGRRGAGGPARRVARGPARTYTLAVPPFRVGARRPPALTAG